MIYIDSDEIAQELIDSGEWFVHKFKNEYHDGYRCTRKLVSFFEGIKNINEIINPIND